MTTGSTARSALPGLALAVGAAVVAWAVNLAVPALSALLVAILLGVALTNIVKLPDALRPGLAIASKPLLRLGIVLLGLQLALTDIAALGWGVLVLVVAVVVTGFATAELVGRALGLRWGARMLIGSGTSICGAAAVAAVDDVLHHDKHEEDAVTAIALVVLFGTLMIPLVPFAAGLLGLDQHTAGLWAGASIHEVAQVVAAGGIIGADALTVAVVVKLARVLMLAPAIAVLMLVERRAAGPDAPAGKRPPLVPWFVAGFLVAAIIRTLGVLPTVVLDGAKILQTLLLAAAMFALGCGVRFATLRTVGGRPLVLMLAVTLAVCLVGLAGAFLLA